MLRRNVKVQSHTASVGVVALGAPFCTSYDLDQQTFAATKDEH